MAKQELADKLDEAISTFSAESRAICDDPYSKDPVTKGELYEMQRQVYYALRTFREAILEHIG